MRHEAACTRMLWRRVRLSVRLSHHILSLFQNGKRVVKQPAMYCSKGHRTWNRFLEWGDLFTWGMIMVWEVAIWYKDVVIAQIVRCRDKVGILRFWFFFVFTCLIARILAAMCLSVCTSLSNHVTILARSRRWLYTLNRFKRSLHKVDFPVLLQYSNYQAYVLLLILCMHFYTLFRVQCACVWLRQLSFCPALEFLQDPCMLILFYT